VDVGRDDAENEAGVGEKVIRFQAEVYKVQTLTDHGVRVTLDLPEDAIPQMAMLAECQREGIPLVFEASAYDPENREKAGDDRKRTRR
jgi:hypothetical protein